MIAVGIYIKQSNSPFVYDRIELFSDEKISVNSSIQNVNDISKTFTDYSQTFVIPASKQNNKIFKHWYENSNDSGFSTLVKADAYIELDTILFRTGKIQLESCNIKYNQPDSYSITFIGALGSLKDKFDGLFLKDLTDTTYDFLYSDAIVLDKVKTTAASADIMFPLITSNKVWTYGSGTTYPINISGTPIRTSDLFPALRLKPILNMIENKFGVNFDGTTAEPSTFLTDSRFTNAYLLLKNSETFVPVLSYEPIIYQTQTGFPASGTYAQYQWQGYDLATGRFTSSAKNTNLWFNAVTFRYRATGTGIFDIELWNVTDNFSIKKFTNNAASATTLSFNLLDTFCSTYPNTTFEIRISVVSGTITFTSAFTDVILLWGNVAGGISGNQFLDTTSNQIINQSKLRINKQFPEIKVEDFFTGLLKMFNLTCYSSDGINYTLKQLENYYASGTTIDLTKYIKSDNINLNRVKSYKKINFEYEKSESVINSGFSQANGIEYGTLLLDTGNDGDEYNIKLPFEDLNFSNLNATFQVGYSLKNDFNKYIPKPIILYDYNPTALTAAGFNYYLSSIAGGVGTAYSNYKAFGQEYFDGTNTYSLNFPIQESTLTNVNITNSLYNQYYSNYIGNVFNPKARLIKVSGILPTSLLTSLKLNDKIVIRDKKYIINTMTTDLTTGEVQFELLTDFRVAV